MGFFSTVSRLKALAGVICLIAAAWVVYEPSIHGGFLLDDGLLLTDNAIVKSSDGLSRFWFSTDPVDYWPVTNTSFWLEWRLWGMNPTGYHVTNLVLHVVGCLLIWVLLRQLGIPGAFWAALLFAVHPVNVESVAWIAQRKNVLALVFFLLSAIWYLKADAESPPEQFKICRPTVGGWYGLSLLAFVAAMLSKGSVALLPVMLLAVVWWRRGLSRWDWLRTSPFFAVAVVLTCVNIWFQSNHGEEAVRDAGFLERLLGAGAVVWFYLGKALLPVDLAFVYPKWHIDAGNWLWWLPLAAAAGTTVAFWWFRRGWARHVFLAWIVFCAALVPVMGFTDVGFMKYSLVADHYQHVALVAAVAAVAAGWCAARRRAGGMTRWAADAVAVAAVAALVLLGRQQSGHYCDPLTLYETSLVKNPDCALLHNNLGKAYSELGQTETALEDYRRALAIDPDSSQVHNNLGVVLRRMGQLRESIKHYRHAVRLHPDSAEAHNNLGVALGETGQTDEALKEFHEALRLKPNYPGALNNLGNHHARAGQSDKAVEYFRQALRLDPDYAEALYNLGNEWMKARQFQDAVDCYQQAIQARPDYPEAYVNLGSALAQSGGLSEAIRCFQEALRLQPDCFEARSSLGKALCDTGRMGEAIGQYREALRLRPESAEAFFGLAVAHAKAGHRPESLAAAKNALKLARSSGQTEFVKQIEGLIVALEKS